MNNKFHFSNFDLWLLLSRLGPATVIGFKDPTHGMLSKEINQIRVKAYQNLLSKELIHGPEDKFSINETLLPLIKSIIFPNKVIIITSQSENGIVEIDNYYFSENSIVNLRTSDLENYEISYAEKDKLFKPLLETFDHISSEADSSVYLLSDQFIHDLHKKIDNIDQKELFQSLTNSGLSHDSIMDFHSLLTQPHSSYSVIMFDNLNKNKLVSTRGFTILSNNSNICLLEPVDSKKNTVKMSWVSKTNIPERLKTLLL